MLPPLVSVPSEPSLAQTTRNCAFESTATREFHWMPVVYPLTWKSSPSGVPSAAKRRAWTL